MIRLTLIHKIALVLFTSLLVFYGYSASLFPTGYADADEIATAAYLFTPAHPPGYGINILLLGVFQRFLGLFSISPAHAANLFASLCQALSITLLFLALVKIDKHNLAGKVFGLLLVAFSGIFWLYGSVIEVMSLGNLFTSLVIYLCLKWSTSRTKPLSLIILTASMYGLGVSHLHSLISLSPGLMYFLIEHPIKKHGSLIVKRIVSAGLVASLFFLIGSMTIIPLNNRHQMYAWHFDATPVEWWNMVIRQDYKGAFPDKGTYTNSAYIASNIELLQTLISFLKTLWNQFGSVPLIVSIFGIFLVIKSKHKDKTAIILLYVGGGVLMSVYTAYIPSQDSISNRLLLGISQRQYLLGFTVLGLFSGIGGGHIELIVKKHIRSIQKNRLALLFLFGFPTVCLIYVNRDIGFQRNNDGLQVYSQEMLHDAEPNSVIICSTDASCFGLMYQSLINHVRPDVVVLSKITKGRHYFLTTHPEYVGYQYHTNPYFYTQEIVWNVAHRHTYLTNLDQYYNDYIGFEGNPFYIVPKGLLYEVVTTPVQPYPIDQPSSIKRTINTMLEHTPDSRNFIDYLSSICKNAAQRLIPLQQGQRAIEAMECSMSLSNNSVVNWRIYLNKYMQSAAYQQPVLTNAAMYLSEAIRQEQQGETANAYVLARKASYLDPTNIIPLQYLKKLSQDNHYLDVAKNIQDHIDTLKTRLP